MKYIWFCLKRNQPHYHDILAATNMNGLKMSPRKTM